MRYASTGLVLAVFAFTAIAFAVTEHLKLQAPPVEATYVAKAVAPTCKCRSARATIRFVVRRPDTVTVTIVDSQGRKVVDLATKRAMRRGRRVLTWNGRGADGRVVPDGTYSIHLELAREARAIQVPQVIVVDTIAPVTKLVSVRPRVLAPGVRHRVVITYRLSERAHGILFVAGRKQLVTYRSARTGSLQWFAKSGRRPLPRGRYRLELAAVDAAGNVGPRTPPFFVRIR